MTEKDNKVRLAYVAHGGIAALGWWGWWGFGGYAGVLAEIYAVARTAELFPDFTYHFEMDGYTYEQFAASRDPEVKKALELLRKLVETGRVEVVGGTYAGPFAPLCDSESMVRHFEYGLSATREALGVRPSTYYSQEPNYSLQSPRVFRDFGYRDVLLRFEYNAEVPGFDAEKVTWVGLDGAALDVVPFYRFNDGSFCHNPPSGSHMPTEFFKTGKFGGLGTPSQYLALARNRGVTNPLVLFCRDVTHYHFSDADARRVQKAALVQWTTLKDQCSRARKGPRITLKADDIKPVARFGWLGDRVRKAARRAVRALYSAEFLDAAEVALGVGPARGELDEVWKRALIGDNHDALFYNHGPAFLQQDGTDLAALRIVTSAEKDARQIAHRKLSAVAARLRKPRGRGTRIIVADTLPWQTRRTVEVVVDLDSNSKAVAVFNGSDEIAAEVLSVGCLSGDGRRQARIAFPCEFDGAGYKCFYVRPGRAESRKRVSTAWTLESGAFSLSLDPKTGAISRLVDKKNCVEYRGPLNLYKAYFAQLGCWSAIENVKILSATRGPLGADAELEGELVGVSNRRPPLGDREEFARKHPEECPFPAKVCCVVPFHLRIRLDDIARAIGFEVTFDFPLGTQIGKDFYGTDIANIQAQIDRARYALRALFEVPHERSVWADVPFGAAERQLPVFPGVNWCRAEFDGKAITLINEGTVGYTNDEDGLGNMLAMASSGVHGSSTKDRFLYAYMSGKHTYRYWLVTDARDMDFAQLTRKALELTTPLLAERAQRSSGPLPEESMLLRLSDGVVPTCIREKDGMEVRLHEASGVARDLEMAFHDCFAGSASLTRLDGRKTRTLGQVKDRLALKLKPWQIKTLRLQR